MNETTHEQPSTNDDNAEVKGADGTGPSGEVTTSVAKPATSERTPWLSYPRFTRFGGYLGIWVSVYFVLDLVSCIAMSQAGANPSAYLALAVVLTIPGQLLVGPAVCFALAWGNVRIRPLTLAVPFLIPGLPVCYVVTRLFYELMWRV